MTSPLAVAEQLHLDVPRPVEIALEIDRIVAEPGLRLGLRQRQQLGQLGGVARQLHAAPAAAGRRLQQHRIADRARRRLGLADVAHRLGRAGHDRDAEPPGLALARTLSPISRICSGDGPMKVKPCSSTAAAKSAFSERKPRPGWIASAPVIARRRQDGRDIQIAVAGGGRPDADGLVGEPHMHRMRIGGRMHRDGLDPHFVAGAVDAQRDLAAIGDQHLFEHGRACRPITRSASAARRIRPARRP